MSEIVNFEPVVEQNAIAALGGNAPQSTSVISGAQNTREFSEVRAKVQLAKMFPRNEMASSEKIVNACRRAGLAEKASYAYSRGGTDITGPSIRLAEAVAQIWGNLDCGFRVIDTWRSENGYDVSKVEAFAWDMESNTRKSLVFDVPHMRFTKKGLNPLKDPRDIYEMVANQASRRVRNCILAVVPGDVVEMAMTECQNTLKAKCNITPERLKSMVEKFAEYGVTKEMIEARIQRNFSAIEPAQFIHLGKIYTSLVDGIAKPSDFFEVGETKSENATDALESLKTIAKAKKQQLETGE